MALLSGEKPLAQLSAEFGVHPTMISNWKQELVRRAGALFARGSKVPTEDAQKVIDDLHRKIGQLQVGVRLSCRAARHLPSAERRAMIAPEAGLSVARQCTLLGIARSSFYYPPIQHGFLYLFAVLRWATRRVLSLRLANTGCRG